MAAVDCTWCALTSTRQLQTLDLPPLSSFDMHMRPALAVNMLTAALVGELSCCGRIWASCSGCLSEVRTACHTRYLPLLVVRGTAGPVGHTASLISERTGNQHSTNLVFIRFDVSCAGLGLRSLRCQLCSFPFPFLLLCLLALFAAHHQSPY